MLPHKSLVRVASLLRVVLSAALTLGVMACSDSKPPVDHSRYYRMTVGLTYKGQPVDIDFVAGCGVNIGHDINGGSIYQIAGMTDLFRGVRMPEGHAVVINTYPVFESPRFNPCDGDTTSRGQIPKDWLPFIVWFERDDRFSHGIGYLTQDAYESKSARFGFRHASIEHATKEEFDAFRKAGPPNLLPPHQTDWMTEPTDPVYRRAQEVPESVRRDPASGWWKTNGRYCRGVAITRLTEPQRVLLREAWPKDHPDYWRDPDPAGKEPSLFLHAYRNFWVQGVQLMHYRPSGASEPPREVFPIASSRELSRLTPTTSPVESEDMLLGDTAHLGQVFCEDDDSAIFEAVIGQKEEGTCDISVDGKRLSWSLQWSCGSLAISPFFYRDEAVIAPLHFFKG